MNYLTVEQVAQELGVSIWRVYALIREGRIAAQKFGKQYAISPDALDAVRDRKPGRPSTPRQRGEEE